MNQKVSPAVGGVIILVVVALAVFFGYRMMATPSAGAGEKPPGMPADAAAEFQKRMGSANPTGAAGIKGAAPGPPGGGYLAPPTPGR